MTRRTTRPRRYSPFVRVQNPRQARDSGRAWLRFAVGIVVSTAAFAAFSVPAEACARLAGSASGCG